MPCARAFLFGVLLAPAAWAGVSSFENTNSVVAERVLAKIANQDPSSLKSEMEKKEWAKARLAWISLARLEGRGDQALRLWEGCGKFCEEFGSAEEWKGAKAWGCGQKPESAACKKGK